MYICPVTIYPAYTGGGGGGYAGARGAQAVHVRMYGAWVHGA